MSDFIAAIGLVFVIEGFVFALFPRATRRAMETTASAQDHVLRVSGVISAVVGVVILWLIRG